MQDSELFLLNPLKITPKMRKESKKMLTWIQEIMATGCEYEAENKARDKGRPVRH